MTVLEVLINLVALFLCDRFGQAKEMVHKTSEYYKQFISTISASSIKKWTRDIVSAESRRLKDPTAMDIVGTHLGISANPAESGINPNRLTEVGSQWLTLALSIEEKQCVF